MTRISGAYHEQINKRLLESADIKRKVADECLDEILQATQLIVDTFESGGKVMICGNGGSAADSQHMTGEFVCILNKAFDRPGLPAIALTTDTSILTAYANDLGFEKIFKRQIDALGKKGDFPNAEFIGNRTLSLPLGADMTVSDVSSVIIAVKKMLKRQ